MTRLALALPRRVALAVGRWVVRTATTTWRGVGLAGLSLVTFGRLLLDLSSEALSWGGLPPNPPPGPRSSVARYRKRSRTWTGVELPAPYRPDPPPGADGGRRGGPILPTGLPAALRGQWPGWLLGYPADWREQLWSLGSVVLAPLAFVPVVLVGVGFVGLLHQPLPVPGWAGLPAGLGLALLGLALAAPLLRLRLAWDRLLLTPTAATVLASRVAHLATTRADAVDVQAAELRRIERDLHDGAQARLIAVGLGLAAVERLMETDPARARRLLEQARETSAAALTELRDLVRGIHPPVLAERGLGDAVRALALDTPLPVDVRVDLPGRLDAPVESAAYFVVCEALTNAARCASHISVSLAHRDGTLRMVVTDDGPGGADPAAGTGLRGIRRRLATFDGTLTLHSPPGGPTVVTMEIPCASSSPRTSTS